MSSQTAGGDVCAICPMFVEVQRIQRRRCWIVRGLAGVVALQLLVGGMSLLAQPSPTDVAASERMSLDRRITRIEDQDVPSRLAVVESDLSAIKWLVAASVTVALGQLAAFVAGWRKVQTLSPRQLDALTGLIPRLNEQERQLAHLISQARDHLQGPP